MIVHSFTKLINANYDYFHIRKDYCNPSRIYGM